MKKGWEVKRLGEVCTFVRGPFGGSLKKTYFKRSGFAVYEQQHAIYNQFANIRYFIDSDKFNEMKRFELKSGDIIMSCSGTMGKVAIVPSEIKRGIINQALLKLTPSNKIYNKFLKYWMGSNSFNNRINSHSVGAAIKNVASVKILKEIEIPLPPLPEQKRIVKILDKAFAAIDKAKENAEKSLANCKELFDSYLNGFFANPGEDWEEKKLGEVAELQYGYTDKAKTQGDFRFIRITDIDVDGNLEYKNKMYIDYSKDAEKYLLKDNNLLMARTGATFAKVLLYNNLEKSVFASYLIRINFNRNQINKVYWYFSKSNFYWDQAMRLSSGSAQPQFNGNALKQLKYIYPKSRTEQKSIVKKLDEISIEKKQFENLYKKKLIALEELKKSILQKAFEGEL